MSNDNPSNLTFGALVRDHLERVERHNKDTLDAVAERLYGVITGDGKVFTTGTGHSVGFILETFYRAGGLACVVPIWHPGLLPLHGGVESTLIEHESGLAELLVEKVRPTANDIAFVASNSGINAVPVELADQLAQRGTTVVALMSVPHSSKSDARVGKKLGDVARHVLDTLVPYGDATWPAGGATTAGLSSLVNVFLWDLLLTKVAALAERDDVELPLWTSSNVAGGHERNQELFARYRPIIPTL